MEREGISIMNAISFETEEKIMTALAKELAQQAGMNWCKIPAWEKNIYRKKAKPLFNAMYNILSGHDQ